MKFKVVFLFYILEFEKVVVIAVKFCYFNIIIENIFESLDDEVVKNFLNFLVEVGYQLFLEYVSFIFGIEGVLRSFIYQFVCYRIVLYL